MAGRVVHSRRLADHVGSIAHFQDTAAPLVSVFTLGRFSLLLDGKAVQFARKAPRRPLDLLKALVAAGGRDVAISYLTQSLWPDAEGDAAQRSFDTTLHRLRKLLGHEQVLIVRDGKLSLSSEHCWVDVWRLERLFGQAQRLLVAEQGDETIGALVAVNETLANLYQGHFLGREDLTSWSVSLHERLRSKYIHHLIEAGRYLEQHGRREQAMRCYHKGLDIDDLVELFYQRLMSCYLESGRLSEGLSTYRRCRQVLSVSLGLQPEAETEHLHTLLKNARLDTRSA